MNKMRKILLCAITLVLLFSAVSCSSSEKANQDINPIEVLRAVLDKLQINSDDVGGQSYSEGDEEHILNDILLKMIYPPSFGIDGDIVYTLDLFGKYAVVQYEKFRPVIFEMGIFKASDKNNITQIENMCKERIAKVKNEIFEYNKEKAYYADNSEVYIFDNYVYYIIAEDSSAAYETVKSELALK